MVRAWPAARRGSGGPGHPVLHELDRATRPTPRCTGSVADGSISDEARRGLRWGRAARARPRPRGHAYARALADWPDEPSLLYARALMGTLRRHRAAEADLRKILLADPENVAALNAQATPGRPHRPLRQALG